MTTEPPKEHQHTLLVVDDDQLVVTAITRILSREGYRVLSAHDASEALRVLGGQSVDLMISDIDMPGMSGVELVARVRHLFPDVVRILLSGRGSLDAALAAINEGEVYRFLTKPIGRTVLLEVVKEGIERLEELRRASAARRAASQRSELIQELEREHPGITAVSFLDGAYLLDDERMEKLAQEVRIPGLRALVR
ncbi:response regulator [Myxococcota bacterium]|nr:response regulator [Myxococcota bacterium]